MKKHLRILAAALLIFSLSACADMEKSEVSESSTTQMAKVAVSEVEQEDQAEHPASSSDSKKAVSSSSKATSKATSKPPKSTPKPVEKSRKPVQKDSPIIQSTEPPKQDASKSTEPAKVQVTATPTPTPAPTPVPTPVPTPQPPEPTPEPVVEEPNFDIGYWVGYAQNYAAGVGLTLESSAVDCWDNPIPAGAYCQNIESDIQSRLNRYANDPDITDVWIWSESLGGGSYNIYIGYA